MSNISFEEWSKKKKEKEKERRASSSASSVGTSSSPDKSFEEWSLEKKYASDMVDEDYINQYINDFNTYATSSQNDYKNANYGNIGSFYNRYNESGEDLLQRTNTIKSYLITNKGSIEPDAYKDFTAVLDENIKAISTTKKVYSDANKYYSQWESEKDYNDYLKGVEEREKLLKFDTKAAKTEIDDIDSRIASLESNISQMQTDYNNKYGSGNGTQKEYAPMLGNNDPYANTPNNGNPYGSGAYRPPANPTGVVSGTSHEAQEMLDKIGAAQNELATLRKDRSAKNTTYNRAMHLQTADNLYNTAINSKDFELYSEEGADNELANKRTAYDNGYELGEATTLTLEQRFAKYATNEEMDIYSYYIGKGDEVSAQAFLTSMEETINSRKGLDMFETLEDNTALEMAFGVAAGLQQFGTGIGNLFTDKDYYAPTATQMTSASVREDLADDGFKLPEFMGGSSVGQIGYDLINTTANMLPSILTSAAVTYATKGVATPAVAQALGGAVGSTILGASAGGNAYAEMINLGYDKGQARTYAALVGGSEAGLQYLMGGIGKLGGIATKKGLTAIVNNIDSALARGAIKFGGKIASEGLEEYAQEILDPFFRNIAFNESNEINLFSPEAMYSGVLGALSAGFLDGIPSAATSGINAVRTLQTGKTVMQNKNFDVSRLIELGHTMSADSVAYKIADKVNEKTGAYTIGRLFNSIGAELSAQNKADIVKSLTRKGVAEANANTIAEWLGATVSGAKLTKNQIRALELNEDIANTFRDVVINPNSTINQRRQAWFEAGGFDIASNTDADMNAYSPDAVIDRINESQMLTTQSAPSLETQLSQLAHSAVTGDVAGETEAQSGVFIPLANQTAPVQGTTKIKALDSITVQELDVSPVEGKTILKSTNEDVNIKKIASVKDGAMSLELDDGRVVSSKDVSYGTQGEALVYETVTDLTADVSSANAIVGIFKAAKPSSPRAWLAGAAAVYTDGMYNIPYAEVATQDFTDNLTESEKQFLYNLGKKYSKAKANAEENRLKMQKSAIKKTARKKGKVTLNGKENFNTKGFTDVQRASLSYANILSEITGVEVRLFESEKVNGRFVYTDENGELKAAPNGKYIPGSNIIMLDINSGIKGEGTMLYTLSHELTHYIKEWSPAKFQSLANFLMEQYGKQGQSVDELVQAQIRKAKSNGRTIDYDTAYEEVIADSMESMLTDGKVIKKLQQLYNQNKTLFEKISDFINKWVDKVKQIYSRYSPNSKEGKLVLEMKDSLEELQSKFAEAIYEASGNVTDSLSEEEFQSQMYSFRTSSSGMANDNLLPYSDDMIANFNQRGDIVIDSLNALNQAVMLAFNRPNLKATAYFGIIKSDIISKIESKIPNLPQELKGYLFKSGKDYSVAATLDSIRHIVDDKNLSQEDVIEYLDRLADTIVDFDSVTFDYYTDSYGKKNNGLLFKKVFDDGVIASFNLVSHGKRSLKLQTIYLDKASYKKKKLATTLPIHDSVSAHTPKARGSQTSKNIISNPEDVVKLSDRYSDIDLNEPALFYFGKTYSWKETGYLLTNGSKLDFSGKHYGASGGYRTVDHREILDSFPADIQDDFDGNEAMVEFMRRGNIRIMPEGDGINLSVLPTEAQEKALTDFISRARGEVTLDIDNEYGETVVSVEYPKGTRSDRVLRDIRQYFKDGTKPVISDLSRFRYSDRDYSFDPELVADLQADADKLKSDVANLKELLKLQQTVTHGTVFTKTSVNAAASKLMKTFGMNQGKVELATALNEFYRFVASSEDLSWESVMTEAGKVADRVIELVPAREQRNDYSEKILKEISKSQVSLTEEQKAEISSKYGSYNNFRKSHMGSMVLSDKGISLEKQWQEWAELYPDVFDKDVTAADMPEALSDIVSDLRLTRKMVKELDTAESRQMMLNEIYDSYWSVSTLHTLADRHQKQVNLLKSKHNSQMSELRAEYKEREKKTAQRYQDMIKRIREHKNRQMEEYKEAVRVSKERMSEQKKRTVMRNKIKKVVGELNQYLLNGTKDKHVMEGMQKVVAEALDILNMDTVGADERVEKYNALIAEATDPDVIEALTATRDRIQGQGDRLSEKLTSLKSAYADIINSSDPLIANAHDDVVEAKIASVAEAIGNTSLRDMSMSQLEEVYDLYKMVLTNIRKANKLFAAEKQETIEELGFKVDGEVKEVTKQKDRMLAINSFARKMGYKELKPIYFFRMLGSDTMSSLYKSVRDGQNTWYKDASEAKAFRLETEKNHNYKKWDFKKKHTFEAKSGKSFDLTLSQIMSIYAFSRREQALDHLIKGGIVFDDSVKIKDKAKKTGIPLSYTVNTSDAFNLSEYTLGEIIATLTDEQKSFVETMQTYLSDTMGAKGNEVSLELYGVKMFKEKNYFPLKSSQYYMAFTAEETGETKIKNSSFSKETVKHANNPIVLSDFMDVWAKHVNDMSMYHAFVLPLEDFSRVYNYRTPTSEGSETTSVKSTIHNHFTESANDYIKQLLKDINGGSVSGTGTQLIDKMIGLAKKGAVFASASVVVQQPSAIVRAMAHVNPKYFLNASSFNLLRHKRLWKECKQYAPIAGIKEMGYFDTSVGRTGIDWLKADEYDSWVEKAFATFHSAEQFKANFNDALSWAPSMADELSWVALWEAIKRETKSTTNLKVGSEEFFKHCGERFTEVVDLTQVYDSVFSRSELMRSKDRMVKAATAFMAEPTVSANMLFDAGLQAHRSDKNLLGKTAKFAGTASFVVAAVIVNSLLKSAVLAGRDDDEDETYFEKYVASFTGDVLNGMNPLTLIPFVKDVISIIQGYSVDRMDMSVIDALITSIMDFGNENKSVDDKVWGFIGAAAQLFGIPAKNIYRDYKGTINTYNTFTNGTTTTRTGLTSALKEGLSGTVTGTIASKFGSDALDTSKGKQYYDAVMDGDTAHANRIVASYGDKKKADNAIVDALKNFEPRVVEAAQAHIDGNTTERVRISKEIIADGFAQDYVVKAVNGMVSKLEKGEGESESSGKPKSLYTKEDYFNAAYDGNTSEANIYKEELIMFDMDTNDNTREEAESSFNSSFKSAVRKAVVEDGLTMEKATRMLADYGDVTEEKAYELAQGYDFFARHPDLKYSWKAETVAKYLEKAEPAGISVEVYDNYLIQRSKCKGFDRNNDGEADRGTKKAQIIQVINSLPITSRQKAVLYQLNGY